MKTISIIIATWNAEESLQKCLDSIVPQLSPEVELIIKDGGSTDSTLAIIEQYSQYISKSCSEKDNGIYDAWNKGVKIASGEWIMFVGADDILLPDALNKYLNIIHTTNEIQSYDYLCALNEHVDKNDKILKIIGGAPKWSVYRRNMNAAHVASLHNKWNLFETIGYYDLQFKICADYDLLLRKKDKLKWLFIPVHIARMQVGGMSFSIEAIKETYHIRKKNKTVSRFENGILFLLNIIAYRCFVIRHKIKGGEI